MNYHLCYFLILENAQILKYQVCIISHKTLFTYFVLKNDKEKQMTRTFSLRRFFEVEITISMNEQTNDQKSKHH